MGKLPKIPDGTQLAVGSHKATILEYLSEGGFAHIYKVRIDPKEDGSDIGCLKRVIVPDKNGLNQLRKEVDVMKVLRHGRSIVKYYDSHAERLENGQYQVLVLMELCPNKSLLDYMNAKIKTKLAESEIIKIVWDISTGVYEMHKLKLIHRDIKIENVLIDSKFDFKLCDFGSTTTPIMPPSNQQEFQLVSHDILYQTTPQYRAPEMIDLYRGFPIDEKSDVWALGCFLYKLCYYTTPFEANGDIAILHASFQFLPTPVYSGDLKNLIIIMLQENPLYRPNIVQVLIILAQLMGKDIKETGIEDFYKTGPYNFHALHEYQRYKQNELLKQQMYYQQSLSASATETVPNVDQKVDEPVYSQQTVESSDVPTTKKSSEFSKSADDFLHNSVQKDLDSNNVDGVDESFDDLGDLDNVEERYPSLDDFSDILNKNQSSSVSVKSSYKENDGPQTEVDADEKRKSEIIHPVRHSLDDEVKEGKISSEKALPKLPPFEQRSAHELDREEAWKSKVSSKINEDAERLADDIFGEGSNSPVPSGTRKSSSHSNAEFSSAKDAVTSSPSILKSEKLDKDNNINELKQDDLFGLSESFSRSMALDDLRDSEVNKRKSAALVLNEGDKDKAKPIINHIFQSEPVVNVKDPIVPFEKPKGLEESHYAIDGELRNDFAHPRKHDNDGEDIGLDSTASRPISQNDKKHRNPWEEYRNPLNAANIKDPPLKHAPQVHEFVDVPTSEHDLKSLNKSQVHGLPNEAPRMDYEPPSLIDLEIGLNPITSSATPVLKPHITKDINESDHPLLDGAEDKARLKDPASSFKKRISSRSTPSNFTFQEEIIDFASDDENPENNSAMSRLSIRNSLKKPKSRKTSDNKKSEHQIGDTHVRRSFFGGNKD